VRAKVVLAQLGRRIREQQLARCARVAILGGTRHHLGGLDRVVAPGDAHHDDLGALPAGGVGGLPSRACQGAHVGCQVLGGRQVAPEGGRQRPDLQPKGVPAVVGAMQKTGLAERMEQVVRALPGHPQPLRYLPRGQALRAASDLEENVSGSRDGLDSGAGTILRDRPGRRLGDLMFVRHW
jgi:hypothetical protein